jgi:uncharacterized protein (UPF0147 family)
MDKPISNFKQIMDLVEQYPNDQELGKNVRQVYWEQRKNVKNPNQLNIFDEDSRDDVILGYD